MKFLLRTYAIAAMLIICQISAVICANAGDGSSEALKRSSLLRARAYLESGNLNQAKQVLSALAANHPDDRYILADLAAVYRRTGEDSLAEPIFRRLVRLYPESQAYITDLAFLLHDNGRFSDTRKLLETFISAHPETGPQFELLLADCIFQDGEDSLALSSCERIAARYSDSLAILQSAAGVVLARAYPTRAAEIFRQALKISPDDYISLKGLGVSLLESDPPEAARILEKTIPLDERDFETAYLLAEYLRTKNTGRETSLYQLALARLDSTRNRALTPYERTRRAWILFRLNDRGQALEMMRKIVDDDPGNSTQVADLAEMLAESGNYGQAYQYIAMIPAEKAPKMTSLRTAMLSGRISFATRRWKMAAESFRKAVELQPENSQARLDLAEALSLSGRWREAFQVINDILRIKPAPAIRERALEMRKALRERRGPASGILFESTGYPDGGTYAPRLFSRLYPLESLGFEILWKKGLYHDRINTAGYNFRETVDETALKLILAPRPDLEFVLHGSRRFGYLEQRPEIGLSFSERLPAGGNLSLRYGKNQIWSGPVDAVINGGLYDQANAGCYLPLPVDLFVSAESAWRQFRVSGGDYLGEDYQAIFYFGRYFFKGSAGAAQPLRTLGAYIGYNHYHSGQRDKYRGVIELIHDTRTITLNLSGHFVFRSRAGLDLRFFGGFDPKRNLKPGDVYGADGQFSLDIGPAVSLYFGGLFASESIQNQTSGHYREGRAGLIFHH